MIRNPLMMILLQEQPGKPVRTDDLPTAIKIGQQPMPMWSMVAIAVVVLLFAYMFWMIYRRSQINSWRYKGAAVGNNAIFDRICEANKLSKAEAYLMRKMVFDLKLGNPLLPFTLPSVIDDYVRRLSRNRQGLYHRIKEKLFS